MELEDFFTLEKENEGSKMYLYDPQDRLTEEWVLVLGANSDHFRKSEHKAQKRIMELAEDSTLKDDEKREILDNLQIGLIADLIKDWSFGVECNQENKAKLLKLSPRTAERVNIFAKKGSLFFRGEKKS